MASLLFKIKKANDRAATQQAQVISQELTLIWQRFFGKGHATQSGEQIYFKCVLQGGAGAGDDIRIVEAPRNIAFAALLEQLELKYHRRVSIRFRGTAPWRTRAHLITLRLRFRRRPSCAGQ